MKSGIPYLESGFQAQRQAVAPKQRRQAAAFRNLLSPHEGLGCYQNISSFNKRDFMRLKCCKGALVFS
jgi:hypothetical protein